MTRLRGSAAGAGAGIPTLSLRVTVKCAGWQAVRALRPESPERGRRLSSVRLAGGLQKYSERGQVYVDEFRSLISYDKLVAFDTELLAVTAQADTEESG